MAFENGELAIDKWQLNNPKHQKSGRNVVASVISGWVFIILLQEMS